MDNAVTSPSPALDIKTLLARVNHRITLLRVWLAHDHGDEPFWWARKFTARAAQAERRVLSGVADLLHVERATKRGRIHGTRFATIDEQRDWLAQMETSSGSLAPCIVGLPSNATLRLLREGALPL